MSIRRPFIPLAVLALLSLAGTAQGQRPMLPHPEDVASIEGIMKAYYEVVSGPAGQPRDWARDSSLHHPAAQIVIVEEVAGKPQAQVMTLGDFHRASANLADRGFFEYELHREVQQFGATAHVWSTYEWRTDKNGPVGGRGINSIQLYHDGSRWWILGWMFDGRSDAGPIPPAYLPDH
ncbi:MAG: hypothetical protein R2834_05435 [Rhodothermales bacterium]